MYVNIMAGDKELYGWLSISGWRKDIVITDKKTGKEKAQYPVYVNNSGNVCFNMDGEEVYLNNIKGRTMTELAEVINNKDSDTWLTSHDFINAMLIDGPWNTRFMVDMPVADEIIPMLGIAVTSDKTAKVKCRLKKDSFNSEPHQGYKLHFEMDTDGLTEEQLMSMPYVCSWRTYTDDIWSMIKSGMIEIVPSVDDGKSRKEHIDEYFKGYMKE